MEIQGRAGVSALFVIGLGMLWAAGFATSLATVVGEGISSLVVPVLSGATVAALGVAQCCGAAFERGPKLALAAAVALAGCAAVGFWPAASGGLVYAQPILNGLLFFCWLVAFLHFRDGIADCAVPPRKRARTHLRGPALRRGADAHGLTRCIMRGLSRSVVRVRRRGRRERGVCFECEGRAASSARPLGAATLRGLGCWIRGSGICLRRDDRLAWMDG